MMKNIKDITISIFAIIGFVAIITAFTNQPVQANQTTTPESHVWSFHMNNSEGNFNNAFAINKVTGEVRKYDSYHTSIQGKDSNANFNVYRVCEPK